MTEPATEIERATTNGRQMALSLGVRVFLYRDPNGRPVFRTVHPAQPDEQLELLQTFEPPPRTKYEGALPSSP